MGDRLVVSFGGTLSGLGGPGEGDTGRPPDAGTGTTDGGLATALAATRARSPLESQTPRRGRRRWAPVIVLAGVVAVAALVTAAALAFGVVHVSSSSGSTPTAPTTFYESLATALSTAHSSYWSWPSSNGQPPLVFAEALVSPVPLGPVVNLTHLGAVTCDPTVISGAVGTLPAYAGTLTAGVSFGWLYGFEATGKTLVVVAVVNGTSGVVASTPIDGSCYDGPGSFSTVVVDGAVATQAAGATKVSTHFLNSEATNATSVYAEFLLVPPGYLPSTPSSPMWVITDSTCPLYGGSPVGGVTLTTLVDGNNGTVYTQALSPVTC